MSSEKEQIFIRRMLDSYGANNNGLLEKDEFFESFKSNDKRINWRLKWRKIRQNSRKRYRKIWFEKKREKKWIPTICEIFIEEKGLLIEE